MILTFGHTPHIKNKIVEFTIASDELLNPGVNSLEGSPMSSREKLGPKGMLPASNTKRG
jgi:hypothetical protein